MKVVPMKRRLLGSKQCPNDYWPSGHMTKRKYPRRIWVNWIVQGRGEKYIPTPGTANCNIHVYVVKC